MHFTCVKKRALQSAHPARKANLSVRILDLHAFVVKINQAWVLFYLVVEFLRFKETLLRDACDASGTSAKHVAGCSDGSLPRQRHAHS